MNVVIIYMNVVMDICILSFPMEDSIYLAEKVCHTSEVTVIIDSTSLDSVARKN